MSQNIEIRNIRPEGGDVRFEEVDLDAEREKTQDAHMEASVAVHGLANEYGEVADEASRLLESYGQHPDLSVALSGLSEIMQSAAHSSIELKAGSTPDTVTAILKGKPLETFKEDHRYAIEGMRERLQKMRVIAEAVDRHDQVEDARDDIDEVQAASAIAKDTIFKDQAKADQSEREAAVEAGQRKLDLKSIAKLLENISTKSPTLVAENVSGLNKLLDGNGAETFKATFDMNNAISEAAAGLSRRLLAEQEAFMAAGIDAGQIKQWAYNLQTLSEKTKQRANEASKVNRGVSKRETETLRKQIDQLEDIKLLFSPSNAVGKIARGGKSVDASKRLAELRQG